jgi:hypothetical protein
MTSNKLSKIKEMPASLALPASSVKHKSRSDNVNDDNDYFLFVKKVTGLRNTSKQLLHPLFQLSQST